MPHGRVLAVGGSDSGAGAGIQADIKTVMALGGYATTAVTALTAQDTLGVNRVLEVPPSFVRLQMRLILQDIGADAVKTGMLGTSAMIESVADMVRDFAPLPLVVDPVMLATDGYVLLPSESVDALVARLLPMATLVTPNVPEAEFLTGLTIRGPGDSEQAARALLQLGAQAVLVKGGHLEGAIVTDTLVTGDGVMRLSAHRRATRHTHGTGCTLASAIATGLAQGMALEDAVRRAHAYVQAAIAGAPGFGGGHGPLNHAVRLE